MLQRIRCPSCRQELFVPEELIGKRGKCESCNHLFELVPAPEGWNQINRHGDSTSPSHEGAGPPESAEARPQAPLSIITNFLDRLPHNQMLGGALALVAVLLAAGIYNRGFLYAFVGLFCLLAPACFCLLSLYSRKQSDVAEKVIVRFICPLISTWSLLWLLGIVSAPLSGGSKQRPIPDIHPVFHTKVSGDSRARPAIHVDIKDDSEAFFFTAELYLTVQSSRFPRDTWVILPLNVGDFAGCRTRFVQLPFEVMAGDTVLFNLLDEDSLTTEQERAVIVGCQAAGYCVVVGGKAYCPNVATILEPGVSAAADLLGAAIVSDASLHHFKNLGTAEFIVPLQLPDDPQKANRLSITDKSNYSSATLKIFGPSTPMQFALEATPPF